MNESVTDKLRTNVGAQHSERLKGRVNEDRQCDAMIPQGRYSQDLICIQPRLHTRCKFLIRTG